MSDDQGTTLRDTLEAAIDEQTPVETPETPVEATPAPEPTETPEQRETRLRDEKGRFAKADETPEVKAETPEPAPVRKPPSSWKKDYWEAYQALDPKVADYIQEREQQFASGVSTYRQIAEQAKGVMEALAPFQQELSMAGIQPGQWINRLGTAHLTLAKGSPEQKLQMFQRLAQDYGVPLHALVPQEGQPAPDFSAVNPLYERIQQLEGRLHGYLSSQEQAQQKAIQSEIEQFASQNEHFESVKETMAGLLQSGLATDLKGAYEAAIRLPQHGEIWNAMQEQQRAAEEAKRAEAEKARVLSAKAKSLSPKSATPTKTTAPAKQGLRDILEAEVTAVLGGARV